MFKKWMIISMASIWLVATLCLYVIHYSKFDIKINNTKSEVRTFNSDMPLYNELMRKNEHNINVGQIEGPDFAIEKAREIFTKEFGDITKTYEPFEARYDEKYDRWIVVRSLEKGHKASTPCVIFDAEGNVLALWLAK